MPDLMVIRPDRITEYEARIKPFIASVCLTSNGRWKADRIIELAKSGHWQIWLVQKDGEIVFVGGTEVATAMTGIKCFVIHFGVGSGRKDWQHHMDRVLQWGRDLGCVIAEGSFRRGWRRVLPGWKHTHDILERDL